MFDVSVKTSRINLRLDNLPLSVRDALALFVTLEAGEVEGRAQAKASGDVLRTVTGKYLRGIKSSVRVSDRAVKARIYSKDPRAGIFEWGGTTKPHDIAPKTAQALAFMGPNAAQVFAAAVHHPGSKIAPHSVIHAAFDEMKAEIRQGLVDSATGAAAAV